MHVRGSVGFVRHQPREVELDAVLDRVGHRPTLHLGQSCGAGVVDEEGLAVGCLPEVAAGSDDPGGEAAVGLGAVVAAAQWPGVVRAGLAGWPGVVVGMAWS